MSATPQSAPSTDQPWTIGRLLTWTTEYLQQHGAMSPRLDAEVLLAHVRQCERIMLYTAFDEVATDEVRGAFRDLVRRRAEGAPVAYLVGHKEFYSLRFEVTPDVLIPRPETEYLVMAALDFAKSARSNSVPLDVIDIGCGSGAVAITVARELTDANVVATDISAPALAVAKRNAEALGVADRITFIESDLLSGVSQLDQGGQLASFDLILSNPPYVSDAEMAELPKDVGDYEPHLALRGGEEGSEITRRLIEQALPRLKAGGTIALETSPMLALTLQQFLAQQPGLEALEPMQDQAGLARIVAARALRHGGT